MNFHAYEGAMKCITVFKEIHPVHNISLCYKPILKCEISGSHGVEYEVQSVIGRTAVLPPSSG
jgi:hypothetical protein